MSGGITHEGIEAVREFLREGRHLTPDGKTIKLKDFRGAFSRCRFSAKRILDTYHPEVAQAMREASIADSCLGRSLALAARSAPAQGAAVTKRAADVPKAILEGVEAVGEFLRAGRHLKPDGGVVTLRTFLLQFKGHDFSAKYILDQYHPAIASAMRAASLARVIANGRRIDIPVGEEA